MMSDFIQAFRPADLLDIGVVTLLVWAIIVRLRRARARRALLGLGILLALFLASRVIGLHLTTWILQGFFAVLVLVVVVVFQEEIRQILEQIANVGQRTPRDSSAPGLGDVLVRTAARLAETRTGALIFVTGRTPLDRHLRGGIFVEGRVSEPLLLSLFDTSSPGHDGAVIIHQGRVARFAAHAPLSEDQEQLGERGTRHAAALAMAERTDAFGIVVSEQTGAISIAHRGLLRTTGGAQELTRELRLFLDESAPSASDRSWWRRVRSRWVELAIAAAISVTLWYLLVGRL